MQLIRNILAIIKYLGNCNVVSSDDHLVIIDKTGSYIHIGQEVSIHSSRDLRIRAERYVLHNCDPDFNPDNYEQSESTKSLSNPGAIRKVKQ